MNVVTTKVKGWQKRCWEFAMAGKGFEVTGVEGKHIHFFQELCGAYDAKYRFSPGKFTLRFPHSHAHHEQHAHHGNLLHGHGHSSHSSHAHSAQEHSHSTGRRHAHAV